jgi:hypothetical protein
VRSADAWLAFQTQTNTALAPLPSDVPCHGGVEAFTVGEADERIGLRGQARLRRRRIALPGFSDMRIARSAACAPSRRWPQAQ